MPLRQRLPRLLPFILTFLALGFAGVFLAWRGLAVRGEAVTLLPSPGATDVSALAPVSVIFNQAMDTTTLPTVELTPPVSGTVRWQSAQQLIFQPHRPLAASTTYDVVVSAVGEEVRHASSRGPWRWQFSTRALRILYLGWDDSDRVQLFAADAGGASSVALSNADRDILAYQPAPDGNRILFVQENSDGGSDLWLVPVGRGAPQRVLACGSDRCGAVAWAPDGTRLIFERHTDSGTVRLFWLDPANGATRAVFAAASLEASAPGFSADGRWLSYYVAAQQMIHLLNLETGQNLALPNEVGDPVAWHPWQEQLVLTTIQYLGEIFGIHLLRVDLPDGEMTNLSNQVDTDDTAPVWSPDGKWLAFGRKIPRAPIGRQLWLVRADGSGTHQLTADPDSNFGPPQWSPNGDGLLVQRFSLGGEDTRPGVWLVNASDGRLTPLVDEGFAPSWLP